MGKNGLKMGVWLSSFYKFAENREFFQGRFLPCKLGIETPGLHRSLFSVWLWETEGCVIVQSSRIVLHNKYCKQLFWDILISALSFTWEIQKKRTSRNFKLILLLLDKCTFIPYCISYLVTGIVIPDVCDIRWAGVGCPVVPVSLYQISAQGEGPYLMGSPR